MSKSKSVEQTYVTNTFGPTRPDLDVVGTSKVVVRRSLKVTVAEPPSAMQSLGLLNPEVVAWELLPWSFVIDWFIPIGDYLQARATLSGVVISATLQTTTVREHVFAPTGNIIGDTFGMGYSAITLDREVLAGPPKLPLPRVKPLSEALSLGHCLNGLALLSQQALNFSGRKIRENNAQEVLDRKILSSDDKLLRRRLA
jgi:hypothetical protein